MSSLTVWRLCMAHRSSHAMTGEGAYRRGGRWNLPGTRVVYCAESRSLATLEVLAHVEDTTDFTAQSWVVFPVRVPSELVEKPTRFPSTWRSLPYTVDTQAFGSEWIRAARSAVLRVPSVLVPGEFNYLLNPTHTDFAKLGIGKSEPFSFDPRLKS